MTTKPVTWPISQLEHFTVHFRSPAHYLLYQKRDTMGPCLSSIATKAYQKRINFPHILICTLGCMFEFWSSQEVRHGGENVMNECSHQSEKRKKCCAHKILLFSVATIHGQSFSWTYQKVMKNTTPWILSLKRTCSHFGIKSGISFLLVLRGHLKNSTLIFSG